MSPNQTTHAPQLTVACLDTMGVLGVEGPDAAAFLQGQVTCDVKGLGNGRVTLGALCNPKGRAQAVFRLFNRGGQYLLVLRSEMIEAVHKRLKTYVLRSRVTITDACGEWTALGLLGPLTGSTADALGLNVPPAVGESAPLVHGAALLALDRTDKFMLLAPPNAAAVIDASLIRADHTERRSASDWERAEILDGIPTVTPATAEEFVPQMLNLDLLGGISFNKGCYTGQEVVARTHYLGTIKRRMYRFCVATDRLPEPGARLYGDAIASPIGQVIIAAASEEQGRYDFLAVCTVEGIQTGVFRLWSLDGPDAHRVPLPVSARALPEAPPRPSAQGN